MKYIKLFEDFKVEDIPQTEPQFTLWMIKNAPKAVTNPQEWFEEEMAKPEPDWVFIASIIKELGLGNRLKLHRGAKEQLQRRGWDKEFIDSLTLLHWATRFNHIELAKALIDAGADLNAKDKNKMTPLHLAAMLDYPELAKGLIDADADLNAKDSVKQTPLHSATTRNHIEIARMLIEAGADLNAEDYSKLTPWDVAKPQMREALPEL